jgi:DNA modification methylase
MAMSSTTPAAPWRNRITSSGTLKVTDALANPLNFRIHPVQQRQALQASLDNVGWVQQVVVNTQTGNLIDGHLRLALAEQRGESELPCLFVELSEDEERLVLASLDPIAAMATADRAKLQELLASLRCEDEAVRGLLESIARQEHVELPGAAGLVDPDVVPEAPEEPVTKAGDLWLAGAHKLLCGDSTKPEDVQRLMAGERAALMATDPPYLVDYQGGAHPASEANKGAAGRDKHWDTYIDHEHSVAFYVDFLRTALECALTDDAAIYQCYAVMRSEVIWQAWREVGLLAHQVVIWKKTRSVLTYSWFMWDYEPVLVGWPAGHQPTSKPPAEQRAVWEIASGMELGDPGGKHPTCKPTELIRRPIAWHTRLGELIYEPFSGSGTAIIAAEATGRRCCALELAPPFVDVGVLRWQNYTGRQATLAGDGRTFAEVAAERSQAATDGE